MSNKKIYKTGDGSHTLFVPELNEFYHSAKGAYSESMHVFIGLGFNSVSSTGDIHIFEVGLGTGLNCLLTFIEAEKRNLRVIYQGLEPFPLDWDLVSNLNYSSILDYPETDILLKKIHQFDTGRWYDVSKHFSLKKVKEKIEDAELEPCKYNLVYYDAFGPKAQPEIWNQENFEKMFHCMKEGGVLVTYCAKGQVRRDMQSAGFRVERLPGPPGKREVLRAVKL